jgi:hypothetical protein
MAVPDPAAAVADDDQRGKPEAPAALDYLGDTVDPDQLLDEVGVLARAAIVATAASAPPGTVPSGPPSWRAAS